jgi:hypothetical protein
MHFIVAMTAAAMFFAFAFLRERRRRRSDERAACQLLSLQHEAMLRMAVQIHGRAAVERATTDALKRGTN